MSGLHRSTLGRLALASTIAFGVTSASAQLAPHGPVLVEFSGINQLAAEASRVDMLSQVLSYTLTVDRAGKPTKCKIDREFRRKYIEIALCRPLLKYHEFQPARDADGNAVAGTFKGTIDFNMFYNQDGSSKAREW